ncbi:MAG TPA: host attachment protein [Steroidobacteraceae bacterium]
MRLVVADQREANFFDLRNGVAQPESRGTIINEASGLKDRDLESDRSGRRFGGTHGARHAVDGERSTERHETEQFAREVARAIEGARVRHEFDRLVLVAEPRMLGLLREALPESCRAVVAAEIPKDLVHHEPSVIRDAVPREVFFH